MMRRPPRSTLFPSTPLFRPPARKKDAAGEKISLDEHPRRDTTLDQLARLKPLFEGGVVTAGNASGINDGAAALIIANRKWGRSEEHTSELQSQSNLVCRLLL